MNKELWNKLYDRAVRACQNQEQLVDIAIQGMGLPWADLEYDEEVAVSIIRWLKKFSSEGVYNHASE